MEESQIHFEKISAISMDFPYLCIYANKRVRESFMDVSINVNKEMEFRFYASPVDIIISHRDMEIILKRGISFCENELRPENNM